MSLIPADTCVRAACRSRGGSHPPVLDSGHHLLESACFVALQLTMCPLRGKHLAETPAVKHQPGHPVPPFACLPEAHRCRQMPWPKAPNTHTPCVAASSTSARGSAVAALGPHRWPFHVPHAGVRRALVMPLRDSPQPLQAADQWLHARSSSGTRVRHVGGR